MACSAVGSFASPKGGQLPASLSAAILVRVLAFEARSEEGKELRIHVLDSALLASELEIHLNTTVGKSRLVSVSFGPTVPEGEVDVVVATKETAVRAAVDYGKRFGAVSVATNASFAKLGVSLIIFDDEGMPGILLNRDASEREGLHWEPEILQVAKIVGDESRG